MDKDNLVLSQSTENQDSPDEVFLQKQFLYQLDTNGSSDYSRNEIEYVTSSWSNSGKFINLREGVAVIPLVFSVKTNNHDIPADFDLKLKSDNLNIINSFMCDYNNENVVQANPEISPYLQFLKNTSSSVDDTKLMAHTGLRDTTKYDWDYDDVLGSYLKTVEFDKIPNPFYKENTQKELLLGTVDEKTGINYVNKDAAREHFYYYNCFIRLKDLPFMDSMVLSRGSNLRMLFTLNQLYMKIENNAGSITQTMNKKGSSCPFLLSTVDIMTKLIINSGDNVEITCAVAKTDNSKTHALGQSRLYAPAYTLSPEVKKSFEVSPQRHLVYNDVHMNHIRKVSKGSFNYLVTNAITRLKRLIIVPYLSENGSIGWESSSSPFTEDGSSHPAPCSIQDFNVSVSGVNVYSSSRKFKFEQYLDELDGSYGAEGGLIDGQRTGLFGLQDYESNQGYIVVDLSRKNEPDETVPVSIEISGVNSGTKDLELLCYMEIEKDVKMDCVTGMKL